MLIRKAYYDMHTVFHANLKSAVSVQKRLGHYSS